VGFHPPLLALFTQGSSISFRNIVIFIFSERKTAKLGSDSELGSGVAQLAAYIQLTNNLFSCFPLQNIEE
jgi:hypothetical protein